MLKVGVKKKVTQKYQKPSGTDSLVWIFFHSRISTVTLIFTPIGIIPYDLFHESDVFRAIYRLIGSRCHGCNTLCKSVIINPVAVAGLLYFKWRRLQACKPTQEAPLEPKNSAHSFCSKIQTKTISVRNWAS